MRKEAWINACSKDFTEVPEAQNKKNKREIGKEQNLFITGPAEVDSARHDWPTLIRNRKRPSSSTVILCHNNSPKAYQLQAVLDSFEPGDNQHLETWKWGYNPTAKKLICHLFWYYKKKKKSLAPVASFTPLMSLYKVTCTQKVGILFLITRELSCYFVIGTIEQCHWWIPKKNGNYSYYHWSS